MSSTSTQQRKPAVVQAFRQPIGECAVFGTVTHENVRLGHQERSIIQAIRNAIRQTKSSAIVLQTTHSTIRKLWHHGSVKAKTPLQPKLCRRYLRCISMTEPLLQRDRRPACCVGRSKSVCAVSRDGGAAGSRNGRRRPLSYHHHLPAQPDVQRHLAHAAHTRQTPTPLSTRRLTWFKARAASAPPGGSLRPRSRPICSRSLLAHGLNFHYSTPPAWQSTSRHVSALPPTPEDFTIVRGKHAAAP